MMADEEPEPRRNLHWCPIYYRDLAEATADWTDEEFGAYMRLLFHQWGRGSIPTDPERIGRISATARKHWHLIGPKFPGGVNARMAKERDERDRICDGKRDAGRKGNATRWGSQTPSHMGSHMGSQTPSQTDPGRDAYQSQSQSQSQKKEPETKAENPPSGGTTTKEKPKQKPSPAEMPPIPSEIDTPAFREAWADWEQHRREKKAPLGPTAAKLQFRECVSRGIEASIEAIQFTIGRNAQGLIWPEQRFGQSKPTANGTHSAADQRRAEKRATEFDETETFAKVPIRRYGQETTP
jgi:uncharacterized protein YdaU (DUF1376 family)